MDDTTTRRRILLTGASGYVGSRLAPELLARGHDVRALVRTPRAGALAPAVEVAEGDAVAGTGLPAALEGIDTAYYLIHSMGRGSGPDAEFARRDRQAAVNFGEAARDAGVRRVVYLGGLGPTSAESSAHLHSRHEVALELRRRVPDLVYVRAAMIIGAGSASFQILRYLTQRLPVMITPKWLRTRSQPVAIRDVVAALADAGERAGPNAEVQVGGADVLSYRDMIRRTAPLLGRRKPIVATVPVLTPRLSSYWIGFVTPVETALVRPLVDGLRYETVVETPPPPGINDAPLGFEAAVREALE